MIPKLEIILRTLWLRYLAEKNQCPKSVCFFLHCPMVGQQSQAQVISSNGDESCPGPVLSLKYCPLSECAKFTSERFLLGFPTIYHRPYIDSYSYQQTELIFLSDFFKLISKMYPLNSDICTESLYSTKKLLLPQDNSVSL